MPELPEVEFARRALARWLKGRKVIRAEAGPSRAFRFGSRDAFESLSGRVKNVQRRGKYLLLEFESGMGLWAHLGMSGKWLRRETPESIKHSHARLMLDNGEVLHFVDPRTFGWLRCLPAKEWLRQPSMKALGVDLCEDEWDEKTLQQVCGKSRQAIKVALMNQSLLAGLGNIHATEALFRAGLHPSRKPQSLSEVEWHRLAQGIRDALKFGLETADGDEMPYLQEDRSNNPFLVYGRAGEACRKCGARVRSLTMGGRTTHFCPTCQPRKVKP